MRWNIIHSHESRFASERELILAMGENKQHAFIRHAAALNGAEACELT